MAKKNGLDDTTSVADDPAYRNRLPWICSIVSHDLYGYEGC
ncbi:hypothetical protein [Ammoniphilus sp. 3BR4]